MELKDFVKETIIQIATAVSDANEELKGSSAFVASSNMNSGKATCDKAGRSHAIADVDFDVAVSVQDKKETGKVASIEVLSIFGAGIKGNKEKIESLANRVKFTIPLALPTEPEDKLYQGRE